MRGNKRTFVAALGLGFTLACQHAGSATPYGRVLARGGELGAVSLDDTNVTITDSTVTVWGVIEVPDGSRLQATYAGVDAIARAELLKLIRVRVADVMVSIDSTDPLRRAAHEHTVEVVGGALRHAGTPRHGWERVLRGEQIMLRVWARLRVPRAELERALQTAGTGAALALPASLQREAAEPLP
jgi:hypothetical protein